MATTRIAQAPLQSCLIESFTRATQGRYRTSLLSSALLLALLWGLVLGDRQIQAQTPAAPPAQTPDALTLVDGEQLIGKLVKVHAGAVTFHSDLVGDVTVPLAKVKTLHAAGFAVIEKNQRITRTVEAQIPIGAIVVENDSVRVAPPNAEERSFPAKDVDSLIDATSFNRELRGDHDFFYGWSGPITLGASLVESTNSSQTYTGSVVLVRAIPTSVWLPPSSKTLLNLSGSYGLAKDALIVTNGTVLQPASVTKTDILHGGAEYDKYVSPVIFGFVSASADHNFGSGLQLQQAYGGGLGWNALHSPKNNLDLKGQMQYEQQQFYNGTGSPSGTPTENLASAAITETWKHILPHAMQFNELITATPTFNVAQAYSAVANANLIFPVYKRLSFSLSSTDNYLGDPPAGYMRNSFQFTAGVTYLVK
jgi:hypothetical protein